MGSSFKVWIVFSISQLFSLLLPGQSPHFSLLIYVLPIFQSGGEAELTMRQRNRRY